ncbi:hypothetical protein GRJ2_000040200 [Grus japonensis]|uniref:Uncharacterized protein n=1 Tax=Grus japonensis TaxID=30415 RepID=A0ABC9VQN4_GRUJA
MGNPRTGPLEHNGPQILGIPDSKPPGVDLKSPLMLSARDSRSLDLTSFYGKTGFQKDLDYFLPFLKNFFCCVAPYNDVINVLQVLGASPRSSAVRISPWQMVGLCFHPWGSQFQAYWTSLRVKANYALHSATKGIEKNALGTSIVAYHLAAFDSSSSMSGTAALISGVTSFRPQ